VAAGSDDGRTRLWRVGSDEPIAQIRHLAAVTKVAFSPDGSRLVSVSVARRGNAKIFDTASGEVVAVLRGHSNGLVDAVFSPDGRRVATASRDDTARLWDAATGELLQTLEGHKDDLTSVSFSPDGRVVLTTSDDADGRTWDAATGEPLRVLRVHLARVADAAFSPDGVWIVTAGPKAASIVNAETGQQLVFPLLGHRGPLTSASFAPDGRHVLTSGFDGTVRTYDCEACGSPEELIAAAEARLDRTGRELTPEQRDLYLDE
jgi:WD40 repeat protein